MRHSKVWASPTVQRVRIREKTKTGECLVVKDIAALVGLVQMDVLEIHTRNSTVGDLERPEGGLERMPGLRSRVRERPRRAPAVRVHRQILIDYLRNNRTNTSIAGRPRADP